MFMYTEGTIDIDEKKPGSRPGSEISTFLESEPGPAAPYLLLATYFCEKRTKRSVEVHKRKIGPIPPLHIPDRDRKCQGSVRNRVGYIGETKVYCRISMKHQ